MRCYCRTEVEIRSKVDLAMGDRSATERTGARLFQGRHRIFGKEGSGSTVNTDGPLQRPDSFRTRLVLY